MKSRALSLNASAVSNKGTVRSDNEDKYYFNGVIPDSSNNRKISSKIETCSGCFAVFDGMGGEEFGEVASKVACETLKRQHISNPKCVFGPELLEEINNKILSKKFEYGAKRIGTTAAIASFDNNTVHMTNVGDSKIFLFRDNILTQLSEDDTVSHSLQKRGLITKDEEKIHKDRHKLLQHLGMHKEELTIKPHSLTMGVKIGDRILICSDGLTDIVNEDTLSTILLNSKDSLDAVTKLEKEAIDNNADDNVTIVVVEVCPPVKITKKAKKIIGYFALAIIIVCIICSVVFKSNQPQDDFSPDSIYWLSDTNTISVGQGAFFNVGKTPSDSIGDAVYSVLDSDVVSIDESTGYCTAIKEGTTTIVATIGDVSISKEIVVIE